MIENSKLSLKLESLMTRYRIGSLLVGDQIKFKPTIKRDKNFLALNDSEIDLLSNMIDQEANGDAIIKVAGINQTGLQQGSPEAIPASFDVAIDAGGGRYYNIITIPGVLVNQIERITPLGDNVPQTIAPNNIISYDEDPRPVEVTDEMMAGGDNTIPAKQPVRRMPVKDNKMKTAGTAPTVDYKKNIKKLTGDGHSRDTKTKAKTK